MQWGGENQAWGKLYKLIHVVYVCIMGTCSEVISIGICGSAGFQVASVQSIMSLKL